MRKLKLSILFQMVLDDIQENYDGDGICQSIQDLHYYNGTISYDDMLRLKTYFLETKPNMLWGWYKFGTKFSKLRAGIYWWPSEQLEPRVKYLEHIIKRLQKEESTKKL